MNKIWFVAAAALIAIPSYADCNVFKEGVNRPCNEQEIQELEEYQAHKQEETSPLSGKLTAIFESLPLELQADFAPLKAAVKLELDQGHMDVAKLIIQRAKVPAELEPLRAQMLEAFP